MIAAVTQTLTEILVENSSLIRNVEIDLNHPQTRQDVRPALSLYLYELTKSNYNERGDRDYPSNTEHYIVDWYDLSFVIIPWDWTVLGQWQLLSEVLKSLLPYQLIVQDKLAPELRGFGDLPLKIATSIPSTAKWSKVRGGFFPPALYITIKTPFVVTKPSLSPKSRFFKTENG